MTQILETNKKCDCGGSLFVIADPDCAPFYCCKKCHRTEIIKPGTMVEYTEPVGPFLKNKEFENIEWINIKIQPGIYIVRATSKFDTQIQAISDDWLVQTNLRHQVETLKKKLEQREDFIDDVFGALKNSNSKSTLISVLLSRCEAQINGQKLGVL